MRYPGTQPMAAVGGDHVEVIRVGYVDLTLPDLPKRLEAFEERTGVPVVLGTLGTRSALSSIP